MLCQWNLWIGRLLPAKRVHQKCTPFPYPSSYVSRACMLMQGSPLAWFGYSRHNYNASVGVLDLYRRINTFPCRMHAWNSPWGKALSVSRSHRPYHGCSLSYNGCERRLLAVWLLKKLPWLRITFWLISSEPIVDSTDVRVGLPIPRFS